MNIFYYFIHLFLHYVLCIRSLNCTSFPITGEIGPPTVQAESKGHLLTVSISELYMENNASIEKMYKDISYRITYWKENSHEIRNVCNAKQSFTICYSRKKKINTSALQHKKMPLCVN